MIINKLDIEGFGVFNDKRIEGLGKGVNVLYGKNEAGKSTLLDFIRFTLFDYPRSIADRRPPINGGNHGGTIYLKHSSESNLAIFRNGNKNFSLIHDGEKTDDIGVYNRLTNFASEQLFNNIFAITVDELNDLSKLDESGMKDRIFSMGMGLSNVNLGDIEKKFKLFSDSYYLERGRNQKLAVTTRELDEIETEISTIQANVGEYERLKDEEKHLSASQAELKGKLEKLKIEKNRLENFQKAFEAFAEIQEGQHILEKQSDVAVISEEIQENVKSSIETLNRFQETQADQKNKLRLLVAKKDKIEFNSALKPHFDLIHFLTANTTKFDDAKTRIKQIESDLEKISDSNASITKGLGEEITIEQLSKLSDYGKLRSQAADHQEKYGALQNQLERNQANYREVEIEIDEKELVVQQTNKEIDQLDTNIDELRDQENDLTAKIEGLKRTHTYVNSSPGNKKLLFGAIGAGLVAIVLTFIHLIASSIFGVIGLVLIAIYLSSHGKKETTGTETVDHSDLIRQRRAIQDQLQTLNSFNKRLEETQLIVDKLSLRKEKLEEENKRLKKQLAEENKQWENTLSENNLPAYIKSNQVSDIITTSESVKNNEQKSKELLREKEALSDFIQEFENKIEPVSSILNKNTGEVQLILNELRAAEERFKSQQNLYSEIEAQNNELKTIADKINQVEARLKDYYASFGAENENDFYDKVKQSNEKIAAENQIAQARKQIAIVSGVNEVENTITALEQLTKSEIDSQIITLNQEIDELAQKQSRESEELGGLRERISSLLNIDEMYELQNQRESLKSQLEAEYNEWMISKVVLAVLNKEKQEYEKEKQPSVIKYSSSIFKELTQNKYDRISISLTDNDVKIHTADEKIRQIDSLSRGTKEQLLLALRLGFIQAYEEKNEPLPIVLDDVMVNFDNYRSASFATILNQFSKQRQAIVFTCHKHVRDLFEKEGARVLEW